MSIFLILLAFIGSQYLLMIPIRRFVDLLKANAETPRTYEERLAEEAHHKFIGAKWAVWIFGLTVINLIVLGLCGFCVWAASQPHHYLVTPGSLPPVSPLPPDWLIDGLVVALPVLWMIYFIRLAIHFIWLCFNRCNYSDLH
jgi:hypothetical protein